MPQDGLISYRIEGNDGRRFLGKIRIGNLDERSECISPKIRAEDHRAHVGPDTEGINCNVRAVVKTRFYLVDNLLSINRWSPTAVNLITRQRIDDGKRTLDVEETPNLLMFNQADRASYPKGDEVILRL